jgi:hypothetical protein
MRRSTGVLTALMLNHAASPRSWASPRLRIGTFGGADGGGYAAWLMRSLRVRGDAQYAHLDGTCVLQRAAAVHP